jgi:hypothetical protein
MALGVGIVLLSCCCFAAFSLYCRLSIDEMENVRTASLFVFSSFPKQFPPAKKKTEARLSLHLLSCQLTNALLDADLTHKIGRAHV